MRHPYLVVHILICASEFVEKVRTLKPDDELRPGLAFVAILHYDKTPERPFEQPDALWIKCPKKKDVSSLVKAYTKACPEAGEFVLRHNFQTLGEGTKIAALANRFPTDFVALEAVRTRDLDRRSAIASARSPLRDVTNSVNRPISRTQSTAKPNAETPTKHNQPPPAQSPQTDSARYVPDLPPVESPYPRPFSPAIQALNTIPLSKQIGWEDFLFERLEISRQATNRHLSPARSHDDPSVADQEIRDEWLNLNEGQQLYFVHRAAKTTAALRFTAPENRHAEHWAFWCYYYDNYFSKGAGKEYLDRDFDARKRHVEEILEQLEENGFANEEVVFRPRLEPCHCCR